MTSNLIRPQNTLDFSVLQPGDILLVANPTDMPVIRCLIFWSHVGIVSTQGDVIDAVREPRGEYGDSTEWYQVHRSPFTSYRKSYDILAVRPRLPASARRAAALYAESKAGAPYAANVLRILLGRHDERGYSCASLMWQAYKRQGLDLAPVPAWLGVNVIPLWLARDQQVEIIGRGTRYRPIPAREHRLRLERRWFKRVLGADIMADGATGTERTGA